MADELLDGLGSQKRRVTGEDEDRRGVVEIRGVEGVQADQGRITGAALDGLFGEEHVGPVGCVVENPFGDAFGTVTDHHHRVVGTYCRQRMHHVHDEGASADQVQRLGASRPHAGSLAGGEDDGVHGHITGLAGRNHRVWLRGEGSNPYSRNQNPLSYRLNDPGRWLESYRLTSGRWRAGAEWLAFRGLFDREVTMGSLIKKRRKRMRKKKHKKMLRRTRHQRRK